MKNCFARFMMFMVFSNDFHGIFTNLSFIVFGVGINIENRSWTHGNCRKHHKYSFSLSQLKV